MPAALRAAWPVSSATRLHLQSLLSPAQCPGRPFAHLLATANKDVCSFKRHGRVFLQDCALDKNRMPSDHQAVTIHDCTMCADALPPLLLLLVS